jgi:hypothetical protein
MCVQTSQIMGSRNSDYNYDFWASLLLFGLLILTCANKAHSDARKKAMRAHGAVTNVHMKSSASLPSPTGTSDVKKAPVAAAVEMNGVKTHSRPGFAEVPAPERYGDIHMDLTH